MVGETQGAPSKGGSPQPGNAEGGARLVATDVSKEYGGLRALHEVSITLNKGEIVGLIGPNGSGKTTLMHCVSGLLSLSGGKVEISGTDMAGVPSHRYANYGLARTFQNLSLFASLTVLENVEAAAVNAGGLSMVAARQRSLEELRLIGIGDLADHFASQLSYGDRRRLEIARALATDPTFLLLDEPAAGMNDYESRELGEFIKRIRDERGCGILVVEHDLQLIMSHCDRVYVLNEGQLIAEGTTDEVQRDPAVILAYTGGVSD